jgi:hypothetical protein
MSSQGNERESDNSHKLLLQPPPQLVRILRTCCVFHGLPFFHYAVLVKIRALLDLSWDELRTVISPLREMIGKDSEKLQELWVSASDTTLCPSLHFDSILWDLAYGSLRLLKQLISGEVDRSLW